MQKIPVLVGRCGEGHNINESYQILVGTNYLSANYDWKEDREEFFRETSEAFSEFISEGRIEGMVGIMNGFRINEEGNICKIGRLERPIAERFETLLKVAIIKSFGIGELIPVGGLN